LSAYTEVVLEAAANEHDILTDGASLNPGITDPIRTAPAVPATRTPFVPNAAYANPLAIDNERNNPLRTLSLSLGFALVFLRVSAFHQVQTVLMHGINLKLLYVVGIPAVLGTILCGGIPRSFKRSPAVYWTLYFCCMVAACTTSAWQGDSVKTYTIPYLIVTWKECRSLFKWLALSAVGSLMIARLFQSGSMDRFSLEFGTVSNSNDFAAHLLFCLPFLYFVVLSSKHLVLRLIALAGLGYGVIVIVQTGSRGGLIGMGAVALALLWLGSNKQRIGLLVLAPIGFAAVVAVVPHATLVRIMSFSSDDEEVSEEALQSSDQRKYLLRKSLEYTFQFPILGVGPGQFSNYEGRNNKVIGTHGAYHATHNTFTQVSSECGIPAFLFFAGGLIASFRIFYSTYKKAKKIPGCNDIRDAMACTMLSLIGFVVAVTFLNFAYFFYEPLLGGMAIAVAAATNEEFALREQRAAEAAASQTMQPGVGFRWAPPSPRPA
jgi:O-antigen ligase